MAAFVKWLVREIIEAFPIWLFFLFALGLLTITRSIILRQYGVTAVSPPEYVVGAFIVAKVVLIMDHIPLVRKHDKKPLFYATVFKTMIYLIAVLIVHYLEQLLSMTRRGTPFSEANALLFVDLQEPSYWMVTVWLAILLFAFCGIREFYRRLGKAKFMEVAFGTKQA